MRSHKSSAFFVSILFCVSFLFGCEQATRFAALSEVNQEMNQEGFHLMGRFGDEWPAELIESRDGHDGITFEAPGMGRQSYPNYRGYDFRLLLLKSDQGKNFAIVYKKKR